MDVKTESVGPYWERGKQNWMENMGMIHGAVRPRIDDDWKQAKLEAGRATSWNPSSYPLAPVESITMAVAS